MSIFTWLPLQIGIKPSVITSTARADKYWSCLENKTLQHDIPGSWTHLETVHWDILLTHDSYGSYQESKMIAKRVNTLAAEDHISDKLEIRHHLLYCPHTAIWTNGSRRTRKGA